MVSDQFEKKGLPYSCAPSCVQVGSTQERTVCKSLWDVYVLARDCHELSNTIFTAAFSQRRDVLRASTGS